MKRKLALALALAAALALPGCSALLERTFSDVTPHNAAPTTEGDPSTLRADSYQELVNALMYFVSTGAGEGTVRLYLDSEDVEADLEAACLEVVQEDPLGAYAVEFIKYKVNPVVTYAQADVSITYRRSREQIASIVQATGVTAVREELEAALSAFEAECVMRIGYFDQEEDYIRDLAREAYYNTPASALGFPQLEVSIYPQQGLQRIVEVRLTYSQSAEELARRQEALSVRLDAMAGALAPFQGDERIIEGARAVQASGTCSPQGGNTAYDLFSQGVADSEGFALAMAALCQRLEIPCQVARGTLDGQAHLWTVVQTARGWRHLDPSAPAGPALSTDAELAGLGYSWPEDSLPPCSDGESS